jgi:hypothetical protein
VGGEIGVDASALPASAANGIGGYCGAEPSVMVTTEPSEASPEEASASA